MEWLAWIGSAATGLTWGWLLGIWSEPRLPPPSIAGSARTSSNSTPSGRLERLQQQKWLRRIGQVLLWAISLLAPAAMIYLHYADLRLVLIFGVALGLAWGLHKAWRSQLHEHYRPLQ